MTIFTITFDHALPVRKPADVAQGRSWSSIEDDGKVELENGKTYHFQCSRSFFRQAPKGERVSWEVELQSVRGVRIHETKLGELRKELLARFKARIEQANRDIDQEEASTTTSENAAEAPVVFAHVVTFHHADNADRIGREVVEGAGDRDQAVGFFLDRCLSEVVILGCEVLDEGQRHAPIADVLPWVQLDSDRIAPYIEAAWSQVNAFGQGHVSITKYNSKDTYAVHGGQTLIAEASDLEAAKAAAQAFHEATPIAQIIDLRKGAYGYTEYLTPQSVEHLAERYGCTPEDAIASLRAGDTLIQQASFAREGRLIVEDIKAWRLLRAPAAPASAN